YYKFPNYFEITGSPVFTVITSNILPVADFSYYASGGNTIKFNGILSSDADPGVTTPSQGNGIAGYSWSFGDGTTATGMNPVHVYISPGTYSTTLTVYDSQGKTASVSKNIYVAAANYENCLLNSGFETGGFIVASNTNSSRLNVNAGWLQKANWQIVDGKAEIYSSDKWYRPLIQINKNDKALRGTVEFSFQGKNVGAGATGNDLICEIYGVNGEFKDVNVITLNNIQKWNNNDATFSSTLLLSHNYGLANYNWQTFTENINFGSGYEYIIIKFYSKGIKTGPDEEQGVDNICLPCNCQIPTHLFEDELTSSHAMLIWDNMGSNQYQVQYKTTTGATWTTVTVENTFLELNALTANTSYTWKVKAFCDGVWTLFSADKIFITPSAGTACTSPNVLSTSLITANKATLNWNAVPGAIQYQVSYKKLTAATWTDVFTTSNSIQLTGLLAITPYQWKVKTQCAGGWKDYTTTLNFTTLLLKEENELTQLENISIFPNPVSDAINISFNNAQSTILTIKILDLMGRVVEERPVAVENGETHLQINASSLPAGVYIIMVSEEYSVLYAEKFIKQ
ncbi:MAG: PKD domain-containing protein, partial [Chitinophagales bacterium]